MPSRTADSRLDRRTLLASLGAVGVGAYLGLGHHFANAAPKAKLFAFVPVLERTRAVKDMLTEGLPRLEVTTFGRFADFAAATLAERPTAALAPSESLEVIGLNPSLKGVQGGSTSENYVVLTKEPSLRISELAQRSIGVVDLVGRTALSPLVQRLLSLSRPPQVKRVLKVGDLLPLLHLDLAPAVLLPERFEAEFRRMSRLSLQLIRPPEAKLGRVAIAFTGSKDATVAEELNASPGYVRAALGVEGFR